MNKHLGLDINKIVWIVVFAILTLGLGILIIQGVKKWF